MRPKRLKQLLEKCAADGEKSRDLLCVASLSNFDYLPFAFIGVTKDSHSFLVTGAVSGLVSELCCSFRFLFLDLA